jgi:hypothetical protein
VKRLSTLVAAVVVLVTITALPALADPARPTEFESVVVGLEPPVTGVEARVLGGDSFLQVTADPGTAVDVPGYEGEPYIRIDPDGTVSVNRNSPAYWLNADRYGQAPVPANVSRDRPPAWEQVAIGGTWAWHDHRIHWMAPDLPPTLSTDGPQVVFEWTVPIQVDGQPTEVRGQLTWLPTVSPTPWFALTGLFGLGVYLLGRRYPRTLGLAVIVGAVAALVVSVSQQAITPPGAGTQTVPIAAAGLAAVGGMASLGLRGSRPGTAGLLDVLTASLLMVWGLQRVNALWLPILPTPLPQVIERTLTALVIGIGLGSLACAFVNRLSISKGSPTTIPQVGP